MLSLWNVPLGRAGYYLETTAAMSAGRGGLVERDGYWLGAAASSLGLGATVDAPDLLAIFAGADPLSGVELCRSAGRRRVAAYDCTFAAPKPVSILHGLGSPEVAETVADCHDEAVRATFAYLERRCAIVRRRAGRSGADGVVEAAGLAAAAFSHRTSRALDPHLHTHVLVANLGSDPDGTWSALDARALYTEAPAAGALYDSHLRAALTERLGVRWRLGPRGRAELEGLDRSQVLAFSSASVLIESDLASMQRTGPRAAALSARRVRLPKDIETPYELLVERWRETSFASGLSTSRLEAVLGRGPSRSGVDGGAEDSGTRGSRAAEAARWRESVLGPGGAAAIDGTVRRPDLVRTRAVAATAGSRVEEVERDVDYLVATADLLPLGERSAVSRRGGWVWPPPASLRAQCWTTRAGAECSDRLKELVQAHSGLVELVPFAPGGRLRAVDAAALVASERAHLAGEPPAQICGVAPSWQLASSFEAATGIPSVAPRAPVWGGAGVAVLVDAHRFGHFELEDVVRAGLAEGTRLVVVAPRAAFERDGSAVAALGRGAAPGQVIDVERTLSAPYRSDDVVTRRFAAATVVAHGSAESARAHAVALFCDAAAHGVHPLLVGADRDQAAELARLCRAEPSEPSSASRFPDTWHIGSPGCGESASGDVLTAYRAGQALRDSLPGRPVIVLGGVATLESTEVLQSFERRREGRAEQTFVVVVPPSIRDDCLGAMAEAVRPTYLGEALGDLPRSLEGRAAWRAGASAIESYRDRWAVEDPVVALGALLSPVADRERARPQMLGRAEAQLSVQRARGAIGRAEPAAISIEVPAGRDVVELRSRGRSIGR